jgi:hypothetical protein
MAIPAEFINEMGGVLPIADLGITHKGRLIHCLGLETEDNELRLKFRHYIGRDFYKNIHPDVRKVNEVVGIVIEKFGL